MTAQEINSAPPPVLRKAVKDAGGDFKQLGNGDPEQMRAWLRVKFGIQPPAPAAPRAAGPGKAGKAAPPAPPVAPAPKAAPPAAQVHRTASPVEGLPFGADLDFWNTVSPQGQAFFHQVQARFRELEIRVATFEDTVGISQTRMDVTTTPPIDPFVALKKYMRGPAGAEEIVMNDQQVEEATQEELLAVCAVARQPPPPKFQIRELRQHVSAIFAKLAAPTGSAAPPPPTAPQQAQWAVGDVVVASYQGETIDPAQIMEVKKSKTGVRYIIFDDKDEAKCGDEGEVIILGRSQNEMTNDHNDYNWE